MDGESASRLAALLLLSVLHNAAAATLTLEETQFKLKEAVKTCLLANDDAKMGDKTFGFTQLFRHYASNIYPVPDKPSKSYTVAAKKLSENVSAFNLCVRGKSIETFSKSVVAADVLSRVSELTRKHVRVGTVGSELINAARDPVYGVKSLSSETVNTHDKAEKALGTFSFKDNHEFFDIEITQQVESLTEQVPTSFRIHVFPSKSDKSFLQIMYRELMGNACFIKFFESSVTKTFCDPVVELITLGTALSGFPIIAVIWEFLPEQNDRVVHIIALGICLTKFAFEKLNAYSFLSKIKDKLSEFKNKLADDIQKFQIGLIWDRMAEVAKPGWDKVRLKLTSATKALNFRETIMESVDLLWYLSSIDEDIGDGFEETLNVFTGADEAAESEPVMKIRTTEASKIATFLQGVKKTAVVAKDVALAGALLKNQICDRIWEIIITLKKKAWTMSANDLLAEDETLKLLAADLKKQKQ